MKFRVLKNNLEDWDKEVAELRVEASCQSDRYDELWKAHEMLLKENKSCALESHSLARAVQWRAPEDGTGVRASIPRSLTFGLGSLVPGRGERLLRLEALATSAGGLVDGRRTEAVVPGGAK